MATVIREESAGLPGWFRLRWGAVFGGLFVALGVWILLYTLGVALGFSAIDPNDPGNLRSIGIGAGIWGVVAPLIAFFMGGMVAARASGALDRVTGALHGAVFWGLATVAGLMLVGAALGNLVGAGAQIVSKAPASAPGVASSLGIGSEQLLGPVNERLRAQGLPEVTGAQLAAAAKDAIGQSVQLGEFSREAFVRSLSVNTQMSPEDANQLAAQMESRWQQTKGQVTEKAERVAATTGKVFGGIFFALLLGLISSVLGAVAGVVRRPAELRPTVPAPTTPRREVYP